MSVSLNAGSVVAKPGQQVSVASLLNITSSSSNPTYVVVSLLDRNEYTASSNGNTGTLSGNGHTATFSSIGGDSDTVGIVFTYNAATGQYSNATYGNLSSLTYTASTNTNDNTSISFFTTNNASVATQYANNPYDLQYLSTPTYGSYTSYVGSISVVTQPSFTGPTPSQATPDSISTAAMSFVGKAWNMDGCWVLASNISAEAGASLPITSTSLGISGVASGEWIVAYNGPAGQTGNWQAGITAGEMVVFETSATSGHITTVVSGSGSSAMLVDNITYVNGNGSIANSANDGSANDIIVAPPHPASQEWAQAVSGSVVVYELDCPVITIKTATSAVAAGRTETLAPLFTAANPLASQSITEYQFYDTGTGGATGSFMVGSSDSVATSAATAVTVNASALSSVSLLVGNSAGTDTVEVRAYNGSYWGDWQSMTVGVTGTAAPASAPTVTAQTANQTWKLGQTVNFTLAANTFADPQAEALTYSATLASGAALPSWLTFNAVTRTFTGTVASNAASLSIKVTATDTSGLSVAETFGVSMLAPAAPTVTAQTPVQTWKIGQAVNFTLAANTFVDPQGESLTYTATLAGGGALPSWLTFNAATRTFTGTVPANAAGLSITVTATDAGGAATSETFGVVTPAAAAPIVTDQTGTQTWKLGYGINFTLPANTFTDPQGERLTYTATLATGQALPSWLHFNGTTGTFTGVVPTNAAGLSIKVTATDTGGASASETFAVTTPGSAPILVMPTGTQLWKQGSTINDALSPATFVDPQGETLTYTATLATGQALPSWLHFNGTTDTFTGTVPTGTTGLSLKVTATDTGGLSATETFSVVTPAVPVLNVQTANQTLTAGQSFNLTIGANTFTDPQGLSLFYSATQTNGTALPNWLHFNSLTDGFYGTAPKATGMLSITVTATDTDQMSVSDTFSLSITAAANHLTNAISAVAANSAPGSSVVTTSSGSQNNTLASPLH